MTPSGENGTGGITEFLNLNGMTLTLTTDSVTTMKVVLTYEDLAQLPQNAVVAITIPPSIPGRPDQTFQAGAVPTVVQGQLTAQVKVPSSAASRGTASISMTPLAPFDQTCPPRTFRSALPPPASFDIRANDDLPLRGTLLDATQTPVETSIGFTATAFQDGVAVSNSGSVSSDGTFLIHIPVLATLAPVVVTLAPPTEGPLHPTINELHPTFISNPRLPNNNRVYANLDVELPTYIKIRTQFNLDVLGNGPTEDPIGNALVRATTPLKESGVGRTVYVREGVSSPDGRTTLPLLPGSTSALRTYELAVFPPANAKYGSLCRTTQVSANSGALADLQTTPRLLLPRPILTGTVLDSTGRALRGVVVTATPDATPPGGCTTGRSPTTSTFTDKDGRFTMYLDPGIYEFDYDPPAGAFVPRLTESGVAIDDNTTGIRRETRLPAAAIIDGHVNASDGRTPLANALIRFFEPRCMDDTCIGPNRTPPLLRAVGQTDANGNFSVVVPAPPAAD